MYVRTYIGNIQSLIIIHSINHIHCQCNVNALDNDTGVSLGAHTYIDDRDKTDG